MTTSKSQKSSTRGHLYRASKIRFLKPALCLINALGAKEAIFIEILQGYIELNEKERNDYYYHKNHYWTSFTFKYIAEKYKGLGNERTIKTIVKKLAKEEIIFIDNFNPKKIDRTNWYRINYDALDSIIHDELKILEPLVAQPECNNCTPIVQKLHDQSAKVAPSTFINRINNNKQVSNRGVERAREKNSRSEDTPTPTKPIVDVNFSSEEELTITQPKLERSPMPSSSESALTNLPNDDRQTSQPSKEKVPPCNTIENKGNHKAKKYYELKAIDFKWLDKLYKKYHVPGQSEDAVILSRFNLRHLQGAYETLNDDMGMMERLFEKALSFRLNNEDWWRYDIYFFIKDERFIEFGMKPEEKMLYKSHKQQAQDDEMNRKRAIFASIFAENEDL